MAVKGVSDYLTLYRVIKPKDKLWIRVSLKVSKSAVRRNKLRRRIKETIRTEYPHLDLKQYAISAKKGATNLSYQVLKKELKKILVG